MRDHHHQQPSKSALGRKSAVHKRGTAGTNFCMRCPTSSQGGNGQQQLATMDTGKHYTTMPCPVANHPLSQIISSIPSYPAPAVGMANVKNTLNCVLEETFDDENDALLHFLSTPAEWKYVSIAHTGSPAAQQLLHNFGATLDANKRMDNSNVNACRNSAANKFISAATMGGSSSCEAAAAAAIVQNVIPSVPSLEQEDNDKCRLDEDEWTESTGSSSLSSALFLHENNNNIQVLTTKLNERNRSSSKSLENSAGNFYVSFSTTVSSSSSAAAIVPQQQQEQQSGDSSSSSSSEVKDASARDVSSSLPSAAALFQLPRVEILPGCFAVFQGAQETWNCICSGSDNQQQDKLDQNPKTTHGGHCSSYKFVTCCNTNCRAELCCVDNCHYVLCPDCFQITQDKKQPQLQGGVNKEFITFAGLGFTFIDLRNWEQRQGNKQHTSLLPRT